MRSAMSLTERFSPNLGALDRYSDCNGDFVLLDALSCGFEGDGANESIKIVDDALIEAIELRSL
jgi:hypothetical protein